MSYSSEVEAVLEELRDEINDQPGQAMSWEWEEVRKRHDVAVADALSRIREITERVVIGEDEPRPDWDNGEYLYIIAKNRFRAEQRITLHETQEEKK